ncbi:Ras-like protein, 24 kDa [Ceratobasidium sp. AG-Ba]|nr:Ras-like protein, 24 kDa [Ceratobasidium sp. AG-Ba]
MCGHATQQAQLYREYKLVVVGGGGVGKSALTIQFIQSHFVDEYDPTIEGMATVVGPGPNRRYRVPFINQIVPQAEEYGAMREQYMRTGEGFLLVYSITSRNSFEEISNLPPTDLACQGQGLVPHDRRGQQVRPGRVGPAKHFGTKFIETSAKQRINVDEAFAISFAKFADTKGPPNATWQREYYPAHEARREKQDGGCCGCVVV